MSDKPTDRALDALAPAMTFTAGSLAGLCTAGIHHCDLMGQPEGTDVWPPFEEAE